MTPIYKLSASSITGRTTYGSMLAGNTAYSPLATTFDSLATVTVGAGGASSVEFTNISTNYGHLQIRGWFRFPSNGDIALLMGNGTIDTGSNYSFHSLYSQGANLISFGSSNSNRGVYLGYYISGANVFGSFVCDILDYNDTNKNKTVRTMEGYDTSGSGTHVMVNSGTWLNTAAVNTIRVFSPDSINFQQYSHIALYGIPKA